MAILRKAFVGHRMIMWSLLVCSCAHITTKLRTELDEREYDRTIERGEQWLVDSKEDLDANADRNSVRLLVAEARLRKAQVVDSVQAYEQFRKAHQGDGLLFHRELREALEGEAHAFYRDLATSSYPLEGLRTYLARYPGQRDRDDARRLEVEAAFQIASSADIVQHLAEFRDHYKLWPEATEALRQASWREAASAFRTMDASSDVGTAARLRSRYQAVVGRDALDVMEATAAVRVLATAIIQGTLLDDLSSTQFLALYGRNPAVTALVGSLHDRVWSIAQTENRANGFRLFRMLFPASPHVEAALEADRERTWNGAVETGDPQIYLDFATTFPSDLRSHTAERRFYSLVRIQERKKHYPQVTVHWQRKLPSGEIELYVDVTDCTGMRISGLTRESFEVYSDGDSVPLAGFLGLEDDRPLNVLFGLDLSGSMAVERDAVSKAVVLFAETFAFRGRDAKIGLVTFSDTITARHAPTRGIGLFRRWMAKSPPTSGGMSEDSAGALLQMARMPRRPDVEQAVVLITDEGLQINKDGLAALQAGGDPFCDRVSRATMCLAKCGYNSECQVGCAMSLGAAVTRSCGGSRNRRVCLVQAALSAVDTASSRCVHRLEDGSQLMDRLVEELGKTGARPFLVYPDFDGQTGQTTDGFETLVRRAGARHLSVPQDAMTPEPYIVALLDVADQLSKQYVLRIRMPASQRGPLHVLARNSHFWKPLGVVPDGTLLGLFHLGNTGVCPDLFAVTRQGGVLSSSGCSRTWEIAVPLPPRRSALTAVSDDTSIVVILDDGSVLEFGSGKAAVMMDTQGLRVAQAAFNQNGDLWAVGTTSDGLLAVARRAKGQGAFELGGAINGVTLDPAPAMFTTRDADGEFVCVLVRSDKRICLRGLQGTAEIGSVQGLPSTALAGPTVRALGFGEREGVALLAASDGAVYRTNSAGSVWSQVLPGSPSLRSLAVLPGVTPAVCASSEDAVVCSEDDGLTWFQAGRHFDAPGGGTLVAAGAELLLAQRSGLSRLDAISSRDIPSSAAYFDTAKDTPKAALLPFLHQLSRRMRDDASLSLRVEGHADSRGGSEDNDNLAARRAKQVAAIVASYGDIDPSRIDIASYGEMRPIRAGSSATDFARNRRVELILTRRAVAEGWGADPCEGVVVPDETEPPIELLDEEESSILDGVHGDGDETDDYETDDYESDEPEQ